MDRLDLSDIAIFVVFASGVIGVISRYLLKEIVFCYLSIACAVIAIALTLIDIYIYFKEED